MVINGKVERPSPIVTFDIKDEVLLKLLGFYVHSNPTNWDKQIDAFSAKREDVCIYYECASVALQSRLFRLFTPSIQ